MTLPQAASESVPALGVPSLLSAGVTSRLAGVLMVAVGLWLAVAWALDWLT